MLSVDLVPLTLKIICFQWSRNQRPSNCTINTFFVDARAQAKKERQIKERLRNLHTTVSAVCGTLSDANAYNFCTIAKWKIINEYKIMVKNVRNNCLNSIYGSAETMPNQLIMSIHIGTWTKIMSNTTKVHTLNWHRSRWTKSPSTGLIVALLSLKTCI